MFAIAGLFLLLTVLGAVFVAFVVLAVLCKLVFKVALLPLALAFGLLKLVFVAMGVLVLLVVAGPVLLVAGVVLLPFALLGGLAWAAISAVT